MKKVELSKQYLEKVYIRLVEGLKVREGKYHISTEILPSPVNPMLDVETLTVRRVSNNDLVLSTSIPISEDVVHYSINTKSLVKVGTYKLVSENLTFPLIKLSLYILLVQLNDR